MSLFVFFCVLSLLRNMKDQTMFCVACVGFRRLSELWAPAGKWFWGLDPYTVLQKHRFTLSLHLLKPHHMYIKLTCSAASFSYTLNLFVLQYLVKKVHVYIKGIQIYLFLHFIVVRNILQIQKKCLVLVTLFKPCCAVQVVV